MSPPKPENEKRGNDEPRPDEKLSTLAHLRRLIEVAELPWTHYAEWYHGTPSDDCCEPIPGDYRAPAWGGDDVLVTPRGSDEALDGCDMAFAAASSIAMPLLVDLYEAVLAERPNTYNASHPVEMALARLDVWLVPAEIGSAR